MDGSSLKSLANHHGDTAMSAAVKPTIEQLRKLIEQKSVKKPEAKLNTPAL